MPMTSQRNYSNPNEMNIQIHASLSKKVRNQPQIDFAEMLSDLLLKDHLDRLLEAIGGRCVKNMHNL